MESVSFYCVSVPGLTPSKRVAYEGVRHYRGTFESARLEEKHILHADHWEVSNEQVVEMTGQSIAHWTEVLNLFDAEKKRANDVVAHLKNQHRVPGNWARTLATGYLQRQG